MDRRGREGDGRTEEIDSTLEESHPTKGRTGLESLVTYREIRTGIDFDDFNG